MIGQYRTLAELGRGGMGRVLLGGGPDGRLVAVKLVGEEFADDQRFRVRFRREVSASRKVAGAYTAAVIDADPDAPTPWLASVYVPGPSLREAIGAAGVLAEEPALRLTAGLASALVEVHRAGLIHRDLKPSNVLLTDDGLRVIDFGIARAGETEEGTQVTRTGALVGTPGFMSPEQALGRPLTPASDVFSLGSVVVCACLGRGPFNAGSTPKTLHNVINAAPALDALPRRVRDVVAACLAKDPADRPTPERVLEAVGELVPASRPWPVAVHDLITAQHAEVDRLLSGPQHGGPGPGDMATVANTMTDPVAPPAPSRRRVLQLAGGGALLGMAAIGGAVAWTAQGEDPPAKKRGRATTVRKPVAELSGHAGTVATVRFTPIGDLLATTCDDGKLRLWDVASRRLSGEPITVSSKSFRSAVFDRVGDQVATASEDGVKLWDVKTRRQVGKTLTVRLMEVIDSPGPVFDVAYSPDGKTLGAMGTSIMQLWEADSGKPIGRLNFGSPRLLAPVAFSGDGRSLAVPNDQHVEVWDVASHKAVGQSLLGHTAALACVVFSPDGRTLATGGWDTTVRLWDVPERRPIGQPLRGHSHVIQGLAFSSDGRTLASASNDGTVRLWDVAAQKPLGQPISGTAKSYTGVAFGREDRMLATGGAKAAWLWDISDLIRR
ncbi:WD40 repeat domain-containing serine/threonine protein kinase [Actinomadura xylanilytica]|uniref:WD40 repeat domain-containing serine/threonine protein kinase n=1 Tax=Actinomadura xylanilytica TaxID=887459 RepID=UPI00255A92DE|nr:serine/threonine-protein kinase [Actinomadura xylanilytica]MDL4775283.1 serine/threonine-protein kinase [Actinomadura xylanilytica]